MSRLLIANDTPKPVLGYDAELSKECALWAMLILWHIKDHDIVILPSKPDPGHLEYIAEITGTDYDSLRIIVAPPGAEVSLSADRITNEILRNKINEALSGRCLESIVPIALDAAVARLSRSLGMENKLSGYAFASQGGGLLANSKAVFRSIAAGVLVPIPDGCVQSNPKDAEETIADMLLTQGTPAIIKKEFAQGCKGNEVLSHSTGLVPNGGRRGHVLPNRDAIKNYITENWGWLTNNGRNSLVVERYIPGSVAIFAEFNLSDHGVEFTGLGEMQAVPVANAEIIPPVGLSVTALAKIVDGGRRLSVAMHSIGYRGTLSADAIVTPDDTVLFTEYNGRITGSTHIYSTVGARVVGNNWMQNRILVERRGWMVPSFQAAVSMLNESGLAYNQKSKTGFVLSGTFIPNRQVISYTVVAKSLAEATNLEEQLYRVSPLAT
jgi:hypothetical protein